MALIASYPLGTLIFVADVITPGKVKRIRIPDRGIIVTRYGLRLNKNEP